MKIRWDAVSLFVCCMGLAAIVIFFDKDKDITVKVLSLVGMVISGYYGSKLLEEKEDE